MTTPSDRPSQTDLEPENGVRAVAGSLGAILHILGGSNTFGRQPPRSSIEVHKLLCQGIRSIALQAILDRFDLELSEVTCVMHASRETLERRLKSGMLTPKESNALWRMGEVLAQAVDVLGSHGKAARWIRTPNRALCGYEPLTLLSTPPGSNEVQDVLQRLNDGVWS